MFAILLTCVLLIGCSDNPSPDTSEGGAINNKTADHTNDNEHNTEMPTKPIEHSDSYAKISTYIITTRTGTYYITVPIPCKQFDIYKGYPNPQE